MARNLYKEYYETERKLWNTYLELGYEEDIDCDQDLIDALRNYANVLNKELEMLRNLIDKEANR